MRIEEKCRALMAAHLSKFVCDASSKSSEEIDSTFSWWIRIRIASLLGLDVYNLMSEHNQTCRLERRTRGGHINHTVRFTWKKTFLPVSAMCVWGGGEGEGTGRGWLTNGMAMERYILFLLWQIWILPTFKFSVYWTQCILCGCACPCVCIQSTTHCQINME